MNSKNHKFYYQFDLKWEGSENRQHVQERVPDDQEEPYLQPYRLVRNSVMRKISYYFLCESINYDSCMYNLQEPSHCCQIRLWCENMDGGGRHEG